MSSVFSMSEEEDTKLHLMVKLHFCRSGRVSFHYHNSQVNSDLELQYLLGFHVWTKWICLKIICIWSGHVQKRNS